MPFIQLLESHSSGSDVSQRVNDCVRAAFKVLLIRQFTQYLQFNLFYIGKIIIESIRNGIRVWSVSVEDGVALL